MKKIPKGYKKPTKKDIENLETGDRIVADLGGIEYASGKVEDPLYTHWLMEKPVVSFWCYSGWRHLEYAEPYQIIAIKKGGK